MRISDWSSDVCSSDLHRPRQGERAGGHRRRAARGGGEGGRRGRAQKGRQEAGEEGHQEQGQGEGRRRRRCGGRGRGRRRGLTPGPARVLRDAPGGAPQHEVLRSEEHTSELQSLMRISYAVFCLKKKKKNTTK